MFRISGKSGWLAQLFAVALVSAVAAAAWSAPVLALSLDEAKEQGLVGEQPDGYLGVVPGQSNPDAAALVNQINAQRRAAYQSVADSNGTTLKSVEVLAGQKLIGRLQSGEWFQDQSGQWRRR
jgi:uncharacterized protein YdbL (DUF1318 family)